MRSTAGCSGCGDRLVGAPGGGGDGWCGPCTAARATTVLDSSPCLPVAVAAPGADLGTIDGLHQRLLAVDGWPDATTLRVAFGGEGWIDREVRQPRGRWGLTDATGTTTTALMASFGGGGHLGHGEVPLPPAPLDTRPWTVSLHRSGEDRRTTIDHVRPLSRIDATVTGDVTDPSPPAAAGTCSSCGAPGLGPGPEGRRCGACRAALVAVLDARASAAGATPVTEALALDTGDAGLGCFLSLERWPGWWTVRHHVARDWEAHRGGLRGRWRAEVGSGPPVDGATPSGGGSDHGFTEDLSFPGPLDPTATVVRLTLHRAGHDVAHLDLPITPLALA